MPLRAAEHVCCFPSALHAGNLSVTCAQKLWPLRRRASAQQMLVMLIKDLEKTWKTHPVDMQPEVIVEDYKLLDAARPLRALVEALDLADYLTEELVHLFEARCSQLAAAACWVPRPPSE